MPQNMIEKIVQKFAVGLDEGQIVKSGDYVSIKPAYVMTHDNTGAVIPKFKSIGAEKFADPRQVVHTLDHNIQDKSEKNLQKYQKIEEFSKSMGADFYPAGRGIGHQIMCEEGYAFPGTMVVASDSHSNMYGGLGCLGTPIVRTDAAAIWATGRTWWQIPPVAKVELKGKLNPGVVGKDVIIALCGFFNNDEVLNHVIEFTGSGVEYLSIDQRLSIANMTTEWGALAGVFPIDNKTIDWLENRTEFISERGLAGVNSDSDSNGIHPRINKSKIEQLKSTMDEIKPDENSYYAKTLTIELTTIEPHISGPNSVKVMNPVSKLKSERIKVDKAYLVSCVNSRLEDIAEAANVVKEKKIADHVKFYIAAASSEVQAESEKLGYWQLLIDAGAIELPPGCGPCIGLGTGLLEDGEVGISATNRNFKGRMGSRDAAAYLASPAVVAASAISGFIDYYGDISPTNINAGMIENESQDEGASSVKILDGFPGKLEGRLLFCHQNNLNTDGIYPGKYTYVDDFTPRQQADVVMENYDPEFKKIVLEGDILAGGFNFGSGSSREQAATALKYRGIQCVIAGSFSATYMRNAINNGFLVIECPKLAKDLLTEFGSDKLTINTGLPVTIDFQKSVVSFNNKDYKIPPVGEAAQELIIDGGLENWVKNNL
ncbi:MAG: homoaconitase [Melioribacteraceae bacterium]|nr:homoaconitase [Melioribacteraceae bacterium]MCF8353423.1 homoaconitase [Melioribacteraceae bacterium]MCF8393911.1 homoaconitase [Melioribacteraceae bacterium]MCF8418984.1 homoaconitase [Melioribacteraceae bacterium]